MTSTRCPLPLSGSRVAVARVYPTSSPTEENHRRDPDEIDRYQKPKKRKKKKKKKR